MSADVIKHNDLAFNYEINDFLQKRQIQITYNYIRSPLLSCVYLTLLKYQKIPITLGHMCIHYLSRGYMATGNDK